MDNTTVLQMKIDIKLSDFSDKIDQSLRALLSLKKVFDSTANIEAEDHDTLNRLITVVKKIKANLTAVMLDIKKRAMKEESLEEFLPLLEDTFKDQLDNIHYLTIACLSLYGLDYDDYI